MLNNYNTGLIDMSIMAELSINLNQVLEFAYGAPVRE